MCDKNSSTFRGDDSKRSSFPRNDDEEDPYPRSYTPDYPPNIDPTPPNSYQTPPRQDPMPATTDTYRQNHGPDPMNMDFNSIVNHLGNNIVNSYLNKILRFLKQKGTELVFSNLSEYQEAFLVKLVDQMNLNRRMFCDNSRILCGEIQDYLNDQKHRIMLIHTYEYANDSKRVLVYRKVFLKEANTETKQSRQCQQILNELAGSRFVQTTLESVKEFFLDPSRKTLDILSCSPKEMNFLKALNKFINKESWLLQGPCESLINDIIDIVTRAGISINICEGRKERRREGQKYYTLKKSQRNYMMKMLQTDRKDVHSGNRNSGEEIEYDPKKMFLKSLSRDVTDSSENFQDTSNVTKDTSNVTKDTSNVTKDTSNVTKDTSKETKDTTEPNLNGGTRNLSNSNTNKTMGSSSKDSKYRSIVWAKEGDIQPISENKERVRPDRGKHRQILLDLQKPVECDAAKRMMARMGWKGGALGARGEGITEPIMPALNLKSGAGLGHIGRERKLRRNKSPEVSPRNKKQHNYFRLDLLENIVKLLNSNCDKITFKVGYKLEKKDRKFLDTAMASLNDRKNLGLNSEDEKELVERITKLLKENFNIILGKVVANDMRSVTLKKRVSKYLNRQMAQKQQSHQQENDLESPVRPPDDCQNILCTVKTADIDNLIDVLTKSHNGTSKSVQAIAHRIIFFEKLLLFIESDDIQACMIFEHPIHIKNRRHIQKAVKILNKSSIANYSSAKENNLYRVVKSKVDCPLQIEFSTNQRQCTLTKMYTGNCKKNNKSDKDNNRSRSTSADVNFDHEITKDNQNSDNQHSDNQSDNQNSDNESDYSLASLEDYDVVDIEFNDSSDENSDSKDMNNVKSEFKKCVAEKVKNCTDDTSNLSPSSSKRSRSSSDSDRASKRYKITTKYKLASITINNVDMTKELAEKVQQYIFKNILSYLPLLKCLGIVDNSLKYRCDDEDTVDWLKKQINELNSDELKLEVEITDIVAAKTKTKIAVKVNTFLKLQPSEILVNIQKYNPKLNTPEWEVVKVNYDECIIIHLNIDEESMKIIREANFSLYAGIDKVEFSCVWT